MPLRNDLPGAFVLMPPSLQESNGVSREIVTLVYNPHKNGMPTETITDGIPRGVLTSRVYDVARETTSVPRRA